MADATEEDTLRASSEAALHASACLPSWQLSPCFTVAACAASSAASSASSSQGVLRPVTHDTRLCHAFSSVSGLGASTLRTYQRTKRLGCPAGPE